MLDVGAGRVGQDLTSPERQRGWGRRRGSSCGLLTAWRRSEHQRVVLAVLMGRYQGLAAGVGSRCGGVLLVEVVSLGWIVVVGIIAT